MIEKINDEWEQDSKIDRNKLSEEIIKSASLHQKYLTMLMTAKSRLIKYDSELKELKWKKFTWFKGRMTREELESLGWPQYQGLKPSAGEMSFCLDNDPDIVKITTKISLYTTVVGQLESILVQIKNRDWAIKNFIDWEKFKAGN